MFLGIEELFSPDFFKFCGGILIAYTFIFFIALRFQNNTNYIRKSLLSLIIGGIIIVINLIAIGIDYLRFGDEILTNSSYYPFYAFIFVAIIYTAILSITFFVIGKSRNQSFKDFNWSYTKTIKRQEDKRRKEESQKPTIKDEVEYLYLALKYEGNYMLKEVEKDGMSEFGGLVVKFHKNDYFHDEFMKKVIEMFELDVNDYKLAGIAYQKKNDSTNNKYYVYDICLNSITDKINDLKGVSPVILYGYNLSEFNKQILFHVVLNEYFEIEV